MAGMNLSGGYAAGGGADALAAVIKQKLMERQQAAQEQQFVQKLAEDKRQADLQNGVQQRQLGQGDQRIGLDRSKFDEDTREFNELAPTRLGNLKRIGAETAEIERKPQAEIDARTFTTNRDASQHGYQMQEIGAQGRNALAVANVRHPEPTAGPTQQQQNEVQDTLDLIDQMDKDPALSHAVGWMDQYAGGALHLDPEGVNRFTNLHNQLVGKMSLAQASKLKGQGQISDTERKLLSQSATSLNLNTGEGTYKSELAKVRKQFERFQAGGAAKPDAPLGSGPQVGAIKVFPNGKKGVWDGHGWVAQ